MRDIKCWVVTLWLLVVWMIGELVAGDGLSGSIDVIIFALISSVLLAVRER